MDKNIERDFIVGSEWLYYKIYSGPKIADELLINNILPLTQQRLSERIIEQWHFVRYSDPELHLRLRFKVTKRNNISILLQDIHEILQPYFRNKLINKIQTDTYSRELERYGEANIEAVEQIFFRQSQIVTDMLKEIREYDNSEEIRWKYVLVLTNLILEQIENPINERLNLCNNLKTIFDNEFTMNKALKIQIDSKFRKHRKDIEQLMNNHQAKFINKNMKNIKQFLNIWSQIEPDQEQISNTKESILWDIIHMLINKSFRTNQRVQEMIIYNLLYRYYRTVAGKQKQLLLSAVEK